MKIRPDTHLSAITKFRTENAQWLFPGAWGFGTAQRSDRFVKKEIILKDTKNLQTIDQYRNDLVSSFLFFF
jgi:hypothetical protein